MITSLLISGLLFIVLAILSFLPVVETLPFGVDGVLYTVGHWVYLIQAYIWPLEIVFTMFFFVYLPFRFTLLVLRFVLGHRAPGRDIS